MAETIALNKKGLIVESERLFYKDNHNWIFKGDARSMWELPNECVQMVCTSPPYWSLRKYAGEQELIWGGEKDCQHQWEDEIIKHDALRHRPGEKCIVGSEKNPAIRPGNKVISGFCSLCGAWKGAYGLEPTPEMYVQHTIEILREIRRVLRKDGVVFWNIGDTYSATRWSNTPSTSFNPPAADVLLEKQTNLPPKNLCLVPFRVAIAAQEDGWWVRSVIIWSKPNPMPESVTDRPTESHEYILMLTKSARYYWDADAVREPHKPESFERYKYEFRESDRDRLGHSHHGKGYQRTKGEVGNFNPAGRNIRTVWEFPTVPYPGAHFAVFPEKLPQLCILAATPEVGCCAKCGAPWARVLEKKPSEFNVRVRDAKAGRATPEEGYKATEEEVAQYPGNHPDPGYSRTVGWRPSCKCNAPRVPSLVLDPMMGAGTTLEEAKKLNRYATGYELAEEYCQLAVERCRQQVLL